MISKNKRLCEYIIFLFSFCLLIGCRANNREQSFMSKKGEISMNIEILQEVDQFMHDYDPYDYADQGSSLDDLLCMTPSMIIDCLTSVLKNEDNPRMRMEIRRLIKKINRSLRKWR